MGDLLHPSQHVVAKAGGRSLTPTARLGWFMTCRAGSPANLKARSRRAFDLLKIEWFFSVSISCSFISHNIFWLHPWSVTCTSGFWEWQLSPELRGRLGILGRKREASSAESERGKKRKIKENMSQPSPLNSEALALLPNGPHLLMLWEVLGSHWVGMKSKECYHYLFWGEMRWRNCNVTLRTW